MIFALRQYLNQKLTYDNLSCRQPNKYKANTNTKENYLGFLRYMVSTIFFIALARVYYIVNEIYT